MLSTATGRPVRLKIFGFEWRGIRQTRLDKTLIPKVSIIVPNADQGLTF
jgi:hypothetical protein